MRRIPPIEDLRTHRGRFVTPAQLAQYVGITRRTIYTHMRKGALRYVKIGAVIRIRKVDALVYTGEAKAPHRPAKSQKHDSASV